MSIFCRKNLGYMNVAMKNCIDDFKLSYLSSHTLSVAKIKTLNKICKKAHKMINKMSSTDIANGMAVNDVSIECAALNILQNVAMINIKPCSAVEYINGSSEDYAYDLYKAINTEKFWRGLISEEQYGENITTGTLVKLGKR